MGKRREDNYIWGRMGNNMEISMEVYQFTEMEEVRLEKLDKVLLFHPLKNHTMMATPLLAGETVESQKQTIIIFFGTALSLITTGEKYTMPYKLFLNAKYP